MKLKIIFKYTVFGKIIKYTVFGKKVYSIVRVTLTNKFKDIFIIFGENHPETPLY